MSATCLKYKFHQIPGGYVATTKGPITNEIPNLPPCSLCAALRWHFLKIKDELLWNFDSWQFSKTPNYMDTGNYWHYSIVLELIDSVIESIKLCNGQLDLMMVQQALEMECAGPTSHMGLNAKGAMVLNTFEGPFSELEPSKHLATVSENRFFFGGGKTCRIACLVWHMLSTSTAAAATARCWLLWSAMRQLGYLCFAATTALKAFWFDITTFPSTSLQRTSVPRKSCGNSFVILALLEPISGDF